MCLNPVLRQPVCEKLYHKTGYERKKNCLRRREKKKRRASEWAREHGFNWCLPVVWPLFRSLSFFLSLCLYRFNKASCRVWLSWGKKKRPSAAEAGAELGLAVRSGGRVRVGGATTSDQPPAAPPNPSNPPCSAPCSLGAWQPAAFSLPFFPFTPLLTSFPNPLSFLLRLTAPASVSLFPCWFPPSSPPPSLSLPNVLPVVQPANHRLSPPTIFFSPAILPGKLTASVGNDLLQTSAQWHQNKSRSSPLVALRRLSKVYDK